jgi:hypothetical protein
MKEKILRILFIIHIRGQLPQKIDLCYLNENSCKNLVKNLHIHGLSVNELCYITNVGYNDIIDVIKRGIYNNKKIYLNIYKQMLYICKCYNEKFSNKQKLLIHHNKSEKPEIIEI